MRGRSRGGGGGGGGNGGGGGGGKGPNPLTRSYESNGPDVKIRGTAGTIADKYVQLSRDALTSGDPVAAENYLQHAEHYYRLLAAAQAQYQPNQTFVRADSEDYNDGEYDEDNPDAGEPNGQAYMQQNAAAQQNAGGQPNQQRFNGNNNNNQQRPNAYSQNGRDGEQRRPDRNDRPRQDSRPERADRADNRNDRPQERSDRNDRAPRPERTDEQPFIGDLPAFITGEPAPARPAPEAPAFAPAPVSPAPAITSEPDAAPAAEADAMNEDGTKAPAPRGRRRRYGRFGRGAAGEEGGADDAPAPTPEPASE
ncbi:DUF4167 domain-containing protein [Hansschlegelia plantiphila]|uniref:DUF4167 domain-containing protein n=1 Tax=Hansschlegelia plantiphila TaxID=374655 RepID=A0A9W6J300_9HYPH|nr:DUF4167 domain-containing protein [Hansschlegelia plantiphila]GLK68438.1 hypothetical protein GCM10008179_20760 [Hansschlegelia plantiphila]